MMEARAGDRLLIGHDRPRVGLIIGVTHDNGLPPYIVKWENGGHIAMVFPDQYARIVPAAQPARSGLMRGEER